MEIKTSTKYVYVHKTSKKYGNHFYDSGGHGGGGNMIFETEDIEKATSFLTLELAKNNLDKRSITWSNGCGKNDWKIVKVEISYKLKD